MRSELHAVAATRLRADDQRYTRNRRALVDVLAEADHPLTIPEILELKRDVPQSSAYRNLAVLERAGVVHRVVTHDEFWRYELAEELTDEHHHHCICSSCGAVEDVSLTDRFEAELDREVMRVARRAGLDMEYHRLDLVGVCARCQGKASR